MYNFLVISQHFISLLKTDFEFEMQLLHIEYFNFLQFFSTSKLLIDGLLALPFCNLSFFVYFWKQVPTNLGKYHSISSNPQVSH